MAKNCQLIDPLAGEVSSVSAGDSNYNDLPHCTWPEKMKILRLTGVALALSLPCVAQQRANLPQGTRSVLVNVLDAHGNAVRDLTKEDFRVSVNGKYVPVLDARYSLAPRRIVVLLDMSGSMTDASSRKWQIAQHAVDDLLTQTPRDVPITLLTFASTVLDVFASSQSRTEIDHWLKEGPGQKPKLKSPRKTALFDAVLQALKLLNPVQPGDTIYAITDGEDNASEASAKRTEAALLQADVRLFVFLLNDGEQVTGEVGEKRYSFLSLVDDSGGFLFGLKRRQTPFRDYVYDRTNMERITTETSELNILVLGFWTLDLAPSDLSKKSKLTMELVRRKPRENLRLIYPRELFAP